MRPAKTQISLGIRPVWSESSLCTHWVAKDPRFLHADSKDSLSGWSESLLGTQSLCWFCHVVVQMDVKFSRIEESTRHIWVICTWPLFALLLQYNMSCHMTTSTKWHVRPAKTKISLGISPVWSESSLFASENLGSLATHWAHSEDSDQSR